MAENRTDTVVAEAQAQRRGVGLQRGRDEGGGEDGRRPLVRAYAEAGRRVTERA
ncbi:hypothetical protein [Streptomyces sp. NPDC002788]